MSGGFASLGWRVARHERNALALAFADRMPDRVPAVLVASGGGQALGNWIGGPNWCTADPSGCINLTTMEVDPEILRAFAGQVDNAAALIREADVGAKVATAADGLDGSTTQWAARLVGAHVKEIADHIATQVGDMGTAVRGAGNSYEVTDDELAGSFEGIF
ncbi:Uncharacterised protein [Mycolicibacterium vanbaalenii]|uniref:Uncharacterized protein n=2 Tax=Mycolicibacterium vanbaalenii TaxID=110539 RepID=A0A5S9N025_MYCVN|nr:Uncharacterised protein [Mycolicibacterium vanbaalenii]